MPALLPDLTPPLTQGTGIEDPFRTQSLDLQVIVLSTFLLSERAYCLCFIVLLVVPECFLLPELG